MTYRLTISGCKRFAAPAVLAVGDVGDCDLVRRVKTLTPTPTPTPTEPLSCGCRVDVGVVGVAFEDLTLVLRFTTDGVTDGDRRTVGLMRGLPLLEGLRATVGVAPVPVMGRVVDTLDFTSL